MGDARPIELLLLDDQPQGEVEELAPALANCFRTSCRIRPDTLHTAFAFDPRRNQCHSTAILSAMLAMANGSRLLAVTAADLYVPVLTFVFGEAQVSGNCAIVSTHRLREEVYGLPPDPALLGERLRKEAVHELGHTFGLRHCQDWRCVMASSHSVELVDTKMPEFCKTCRKIISYSC
jgi:archaemetzincin